MPNIDENNPLVRVAVLGRRVHDFLESDIGQYLVGQAEQEYEEAVAKLTTTSPWRRRRIQELQNQALTSANFQKWLAKAIENGQQAIQIIDDGE